MLDALAAEYIDAGKADAVFRCEKSTENSVIDVDDVPEGTVASKAYCISYYARPELNK